MADPNFGGSRKRLHLSLIPQPFCGNVYSARVVILALNPGLNPLDYFGEYCVSSQLVGIAAVGFNGVGKAKKIALNALVRQCFVSLDERRGADHISMENNDQFA